jgi:uncharacterized protein (TIGR03546 family)
LGEIRLLKAIVKLFLALNGNVKKSQIAAGMAWGVILGLIPAGNFYWIVLFIITFFFKHNHWSKIFSMLIVKLISPVFILWVDSFGWFVLNYEYLQPFFTTLYNMPLVPFTRFNNTLVMGGIAGGAILWLPSFIVFMIFITLYRNFIAPKFHNSKIMKAIGKIPLVKTIQNLASKNL